MYQSATTNNGHQERRLQVRKAQEAYRNRKDAATKSLEQRVSLLEGCVEDISNVFMSFTTSVMKSEAARNDPEIVQDLFSATFQMTNVAKIAAQEPVLDVEKARNDNYTGPLQEDSLLDVTNSTSLAPSSSDSHITALTFNMMTQEWKAGRQKFSVSSGFLPEGSIFGNGWFGMMPSLPNIWPRDTHPDDPEGGFAFTLIQTTLTLMYNSLVHDSSSSMALKVCRLALCMFGSSTGIQETTSQSPCSLNTISSGIH